MIIDVHGNMIALAQRFGFNNRTSTKPSKPNVEIDDELHSYCSK